VQIPMYVIITKILGYLLLGLRQLLYSAAADGVLVLEERSGAVPLPQKVWDFSLERAHFGANSVVF